MKEQMQWQRCGRATGLNIVGPMLVCVEVHDWSMGPAAAAAAAAAAVAAADGGGGGGSPYTQGWWRGDMSIDCNKLGGGSAGNPSLVLVCRISPHSRPRPRLEPSTNSTILPRP